MKAIYDLQKIKFKLKGLLLVLMLLFLGAQVMAQQTASTTTDPLIICQGASITLRGNLTYSPVLTAGTSITWTWSSSDGETVSTTTLATGLLSNSINWPYIPTIPGTKNYSLVVSGATWSVVAPTPTADVLVNVLPTATISGTTAVCQNDPSPNVTFTGTAGTAPFVFSYNINGVGTTFTVTTTSGNSVTVAAPTATVGTFAYNLLLVQDANGCSQAQTGSATITVNTVPTITGHTDNSRCGTGDVTLSATASAGTMNWYANPSGGTSLGTGGTFTATSISGTTNYYVDATSSGCTSGRTTVTATVNTIPTISGTTPSARCGPGTVTLGATASAGTINWYAAPTGGSSLGTGGTYTTTSISTTTNYYVDATDGSCTTAGRTTVTATVNTVPSISGTTPGSNCGPGTVTLGATASDGGTVNWYTSATATSTVQTGNSYTTPSISTTTTYYVDATLGSCTTATRTAVVATINTIPTITSTTPASRCGTGTVTLGATASAGSVQWYTVSTGGSATYTGTSYTTPSISTTTNYFVDATSSGCTTAGRTTVTATVNSAPTASVLSLVGSATICSGLTSSIKVDITGGTATCTVVYSNGVSSTTVTDYVSGATISVSPATTTTYSLVSVTSSNGCAGTGNSGTATVTVNPSPTASFTASPQPLCVGTPLTLTATSSLVAGMRYNWVGPAGINLTVEYPTYWVTTGEVTSANSGTYTLTVTNIATGCTGIYTLAVTVNDRPTVNVTGGGTVCAGSPSTVTFTFTPAGTQTRTLTYSASGTPVTVSTSANPYVVTLTPATTTTYTATALTDQYCTALAGGMTGSATITVNPLPTVYNVTGGGSLCAGSTGVSIGVSGSQTGVTYQLYRSGSGSPVQTKAGTGSAITFATLETTAGTYTVTATNNTSLCISLMTGTATVVVNPVPSVFTVTGGGSYCEGGTGVAIGLAGSESGINYTLLRSGTTVTTVAGTGSAITFGLQTVAGTYTVTATNATTACISSMSGSATITVNPLPTVTITASGPTDFCPGGSVTLTATAGSSYLWSTGASTQSITVTTAGTFTVTVSNGTCSGTSAPTTVTLKAVPVVTADYSPKPLCVGATMALIATPDLQTSYSWSGPNGFTNVGPNSIITLNNVSATNAGLYTVTVLALNGCSGTASTTVVITPIVGTPSAPSGTTTLCQGATPTTYTSSASDATTYTWAVTGTGNTITTGTASATVTWSPGFTGTATVSVYATGCGTSSVTSTTVTVNPTVGTPSAPAGLTTVCQGAIPTAYTTSATNATSYTWSVTGAGNSVTTGTATGTVTWGASFVGTAIVSVTATGGCGTSTSTSTTVTVAPTVGTPSAPAGTTTLCQGSSPTVYTTSATNATSYTWSVTGTGNSITTGTATGTVTWGAGFSGSATISVYATGCGTSSTATRTVTVTPTVGPPSAPAGTTSLCQGSVPTAYTTSATNATSYTWSLTPGTAGTVSGTSTTGTITWNPSFAGAASVSVVANGCGTSATASTTITVAPVPVISATSNSQVCEGGVLILTGSSSAPNSNYAWTGPAGFAVSGPNTEITFSPMSAANVGTYILTVTATGYCSTQTSTVVAMASATVAGTVSSTQTICYNTTPASLTLNGSNGSVVEWQKSSNAAFTSPEHIAVTTTTLPGATIGPLMSSFYFRAVVQSGTCTALNSTSVLITVLPLPTVTLTSGSASQTVCQNVAIAPVVYTVGNGATSAGVTGLPAGVSGTFTGTTLTIAGTPTVSGALVYTVTTTGGSCGAATATGTITVTALPTIALTSGAGTNVQTRCAGVAISNITYTIGGSATSADVMGLPAGISASLTGTTLTLSGAPTAAGTFNYTVTTVGGCSPAATATGTITVTALPTIVLATGSTSQTVCKNVAITTIGFTVGGSATGAGVSGLPTGVSGTFTGTTMTISGTPSVSGTFNYTVTTTGGSCTAATATGTITVNALPTVVLSSASGTDNQTVIVNNSITNITYTVGGVATGGVVTGLPTGVAGTFTGTTVTISGTPSVSGTFNYTVTTTGGSCTAATTTGTITVNPVTGTVSGYVTYLNTYLTGMNGITVKLRNNTGVVATTATVFDGTGNKGYYLFTGIAAGTYTVTAEYTGAWLGNNATDALIVNLNTVGSWPLAGLYATVADVNADGLITGLDALMIKDRTVGYTTTYPAGDWKFTSATVVLVTNATADLNGLCVGDVNGSNVPSFKSASYLNAVEDELMTISVSKTFTYNIKSDVMADLGAMTLFMNYDPTLFSVDKVNSNIEGLRFRIGDGVVALAWSNTKPLSVNADDVILSLNITAKDVISQATQIFTINSGSEFADPMARRINDFNLKLSPVTTAAGNLEFSMVNYPNPFKTSTEIVYTIPENSKVKLVITNMFGQQIRTLVNEQQAAGMYKVKVDAADGYLQTGLYLYSIEVEGANATYQKTNKMLFTR